MERKTILKLVLWTIAPLIFIQCDSPHFYQEQISVQNNWDKDSVLNFQFEIKDTAGRYNFFLLSRNNNEYPYSNLYLFTKLTDANGTTYEDTLQYYLAYRDGEWIGTGNSLKELYLLYRENISITDTGLYNLSVRQGMREKELKGIEDLTLIIDKISSK